ncbi:MAG: MBL fold metallo-hydrolase [Candidatus Woesearchaeota archaeon]|jgi:putative mRNA 3-end processing factor
MKIEFHGAALEVGRSCISITTDKGNKYLIDFGIKFKETGFEAPINIPPVNEIKAVFLSHAHLDHSGGLPLLEHMNLNCPIFCTKQTFSIAKILLKDSYKIERIRNIHPAYNNTDLKEIQKDTRFVTFDKWYTFGDLKFTYLNAGHIPGSAMILFIIDGKRVLYTGDFNSRPSLLMNTDFNKEELSKPIDVLITESTYGYRELPERLGLENDMINSIKQTLANKGSVLIPVFALGRAQEILIMLGRSDISSNIYVDGMCKKVTRTILDTKSKYVNNLEPLKHAFDEKAQWIGSPKKRKDAIKNGGVFLTTSGMLQGGPVLEYVKEFWHDDKSKIIMTGFQCKRTNGRHLLEEGFVYIDGWKTFVKCQIEKYDFSGHADRLAIQTFVKMINAKVVVFQHGDQEAIDALKQWAETNITSKIYTPIIGDSFEY